MIDYKTGSILAQDAEALVNTVNCVGVMGKGIALEFKKAFPANFKAYAQACKNEQVVLGKMFVFETGAIVNPRYIINFPTKQHWKDKSRLEDIVEGLKALKQEVQKHAIQTIAVPPLGCGLGGLDWQDVKPRIENAFAELPKVRVIVYEPAAKSNHHNFGIADNSANVLDITLASPQKITPGRAALVSLIERYLSGLLDPYITLLEVHKLMYFLQEAGEPLKLHYIKEHYGPYAENLRHVLRAVEGQLIIGYLDGGDAPGKQINLLPSASAKAALFLENQPATRERIERVAELVDGFETPLGLELLSTVHWVIQHEGASTIAEATEKVYCWNARKKQFSSRQINIAVDALTRHGWASVVS